MKTVFLDSNVILDAILDRGGAENAKQILQFGRDQQIRNCTSVLSFANIAYILRKYLSGDESLGVLKALFDSVSVLPMGDQQVYNALRLAGPDFEDSLQIACAKAASCDVIVTRNLKYYKDVPIPVFTPEDFLNAVT